MQHLQTVHVGHHLGQVALPAEPTASPALALVPAVEVYCLGHRQQIRYSGVWSLVHTTGHALTPPGLFPLVWLRRFAHLLATSGIDWEQVTGDPSVVTHPQYVVVTAIGEYVADCWRQGIPVTPGAGVALCGSDLDGWQLYCSNRGCEHGEGTPVLLQHYSEDGDEIEVVADTIAELQAVARDAGWEPRPRDRWLCADCAASHQPRGDQPCDGLAGLARLTN